jgi:hypothetical protein
MTAFEDKVPNKMRKWEKNYDFAIFQARKWYKLIM